MKLKNRSSDGTQKKKIVTYEEPQAVVFLFSLLLPRCLFNIFSLQTGLLSSKVTFVAPGCQQLLACALPLSHWKRLTKSLQVLIPNPLERRPEWLEMGWVVSGINFSICNLNSIIIRALDGKCSASEEIYYLHSKVTLHLSEVWEQAA